MGVELIDDPPHARRDHARYPGDAVGVPGQLEQVRLLGVGELQRPGERGADLRGRGTGPALLEAHDVVDRDAGEQRELLATQPRRPSRRVAGKAERGGVGAVAPCAQDRTQGVLVAHLAHAPPSTAGMPGTGVTRTGRRSHQLVSRGTLES